MTLGDALEQLLDHHEEASVFAMEPISVDATAVIVMRAEAMANMDQLLVLGYRYFMDGETARQAVEIFKGRSPTRTEVRDLLMPYGEYAIALGFMFERQGKPLH